MPDCYKAPTVSPPGAPTSVKATASNAQASVTWTAPSSNGGAAISAYTVTASPGGKTATSTSTSATVTGLTNGTSYTFTVKATNSAGTGPSSAASNAVIPTGPVTVPGAPTSVKATAGNAQASVTWTAPSSNGGAAISSYTVTASPARGPRRDAHISVGNGDPPDERHQLHVTVTATNSAGTGPSSAASDAVTPTSGPPPVTSKPQTTNSHYVRNDGTPATGKSRGRTTPPRPRRTPASSCFVRQPVSSPAGAGETGGQGLNFTDAQIVAFAEAYVDGWRSRTRPPS